MPLIPLTLGEVALPPRSPSNLTRPSVEEVASGAAPFVTAVVTNAVEAIWVVLVPAVAVGADGVPVKLGLLRGALLATVPLLATLLEMILWTLLELLRVAELPTEVTSPVKLALVVTVAALPDILPAMIFAKVLFPAMDWVEVRSTKF